jgi:hypothetical protein
MAEHIDLADPSFEPSGEQLQELASRAFSGVREAREKSLAAFHADIARQRRIVLESLTPGPEAKRKPSP